MAAVCKPCAAALAMGQWLVCAPSRAGAGWDSGPASEIACVCARPCCARASILSLASASKTTTKSFSTPQSVTERWPLHVSQHSSIGAECGIQLSHSQQRDGQRRGFLSRFAQNAVGLDMTTLNILERQIGLKQSSRWSRSTEKGRRGVYVARTANPHSGWASGVRRVWAWVVVGGGRVAALARAAHTSPIIIIT